MRRIFALEDLELAALALAGGMDLMIDSGFRRGTEILKALALGGRFVFVGRPCNYATALAGEAGVDHAIDLLRVQLWADLGMLGLLGVEKIDRSYLFLDRFRAVTPDAA